MGFVLDAIKKEIIFKGPETINSDYISDAVDIDGVEGEYSINISYDGGIAVNMVYTLEASNDNVNFSSIGDTSQAITDSSGSHMYDMGGSGFSYIRVKITVTAGSIDLQDINFVGKRRH